MSDLSLITAPPADASALAAAALRPPPAAPATKGINPSQPAGTPVADGTADSSREPFAALLLGFLQGAQPAAPTPTGLAANPNTTAGDELPLPETAADSSELPGLVPLAAAGLSPAPSAAYGPASGRALPASGSGLPPETAATATLDTAAANPDETGTATPASRISLADIEHSRQLNMAASTAPAADDWSRRFMPAAATMDGPTAGSSADGPTDLLPGTETEPVLRQPAGLTAGDLSRLVQNLAQNGGREAFSAAFSTDGNGMNSPLGTAGTAAGNPPGSETSLGNMARGGLSGFPPLQPLGPAQAWTTGLGDRLLTLAGPGTHSARLRLHPESLGTLDIEIKIADSTAQVWFGAQHSQTREAIEASLPQLREMFAEQGIRLAHAQVDSGSDQRARDQQQGFNEAGNPRTAWRDAPARSELPDRLAPARPATSRLVDAWA
ncbi:MAG: flagellar hook-length control protein FliK [Gammaproteobacteria bacterium]|nr:flagellar hook-length control protein FliK [Gammaproteobacteria bacterium]